MSDQLMAHYAERLIKAIAGVDGRLAEVATELREIKAALPSVSGGQAGELISGISAIDPDTEEQAADHDPAAFQYERLPDGTAAAINEMLDKAEGEAGGAADSEGEAYDPDTDEPKFSYVGNMNDFKAFMAAQRANENSEPPPKGQQQERTP